MSFAECGVTRFPRPPPFPIFDDMHEDLTRLGLIEEDETALEEAALSLALIDHPAKDLPGGTSPRGGGA